MISNNVYHISEKGDIEIFHPRPSPSFYSAILGNVVFGITKALLHNYLFPRDCPRVTYYAGPHTSLPDRQRFLTGNAEYVLTVEQDWVARIKETTLYCYELEGKNFELLDECAGYYISYHTEKPIAITRINNPFNELLKNPSIELRAIDNLRPLADVVAKSSLNYSIIRMRNAKH